MLINFRVKNFLSFREEVEFTALATKETTHSNRIFKSQKSKVRVLPISAFFGGNGAGKSNLFKAVAFVKRLIIRGTSTNDTIDCRPFKLDRHAPLRSSEFGLDLLIEDELYRYEFAVHASVITRESLFLIGKKNLEIFSRGYLNDKQVWGPNNFTNCHFSDKEVGYLLLKSKEDTFNNQLFLNSIHGRPGPIPDLFKRIGTWFSDRLELLSPQGEYGPLVHYLDEAKSFSEFCSQALDRAGTGITELKSDPTDFKDLGLPEKLKEEILSHLEVVLKDEPSAEILVTGPRSRFKIRKSKGKDVEVFRLRAIHKSESDENVPFEIDDESDGTLRLLELLPAFFELSASKCDKVFFIDELDRSLHTHLTKELLATFLETRTEISCAQLLFTTHDPFLMDQEMLRRDEIWFIDKVQNGGSVLTALSDFKGVRLDLDVRKAYLEGRFSGIPNMRRLPRKQELMEAQK
ncbi:hypothetical protein DB346_24340 [Verrucomicrobia bacterium LW23]|nr:hypothetical protein DB346_24340 [Verrucomicrobia bacterium LW23]